VSVREALAGVLGRRTSERVPCVGTPLRVYTYELPAPYEVTGDPVRDLGELNDALRLPSRTFYAVREFFRTCVPTKDPSVADFFFVPLNLIHFQFRNEDPVPVLPRLVHLSERRDHILVAAGDYSNRSRRNHQGDAYAQIYDWLDPFVLLAHESTSDLITGQDIGVIPYHALGDRPVRNDNPRPLLYSFLGELEHIFLPPDHVRSRLGQLEARGDDVLIGSQLDVRRRAELRANFATDDDYELVSRNSVFTLAPAGYGRWSYRFFQAIQWGSIPVLLSDDYAKPFADVIPYDEFSITVPESELENLDSILRSFTPAGIERYQQALHRHQSDFTRRSFFRHLMPRLEAIRQ
jgi:hypothetical protein